MFAVDRETGERRLLHLDRVTGERTVVAAVEGHSLDTLSAAADTLPPTVFASRRTGEIIAARFTGDRPQAVAIDPHLAEVHAALEKLADGVLGWVSSDLDEQRWVATFIHDREPPTTWFYDHSTGEARLLFRDGRVDRHGHPPDDGPRTGRLGRRRRHVGGHAHHDRERGQRAGRHRRPAARYMTGIALPVDGGMTAPFKLPHAAG